MQQTNFTGISQPFPLINYPNGDNILLTSAVLQELALAEGDLVQINALMYQQNNSGLGTSNNSLILRFPSTDEIAFETPALVDATEAYLNLSIALTVGPSGFGSAWRQTIGFNDNTLYIAMEISMSLNNVTPDTFDLIYSADNADQSMEITNFSITRIRAGL